MVVKRLFQKFRCLWLIFFAGILVGCNEQGFSGRGAKKTVSPEADAQTGDNSRENGDQRSSRERKEARDGSGETDGDDAPTLEASSCDPVFGKTQARLITNRVANGKPGNYLEFSLSLADCASQTRTFQATTVYFDLDAYTSLAGRGRELPFKLTTDQETLSGTFREIQGEDLFGRTGAERYHYRTSREVQLQSSASKITLRIELLGMTVSGEPQRGLGNPRAGIQTVPIYMRFGKAAPVKADLEFEG